MSNVPAADLLFQSIIGQSVPFLKQTSIDEQHIQHRNKMLRRLGTVAAAGLLALCGGGPGTWP